VPWRKVWSKVARPEREFFEWSAGVGKTHLRRRGAGRAAPPPVSPEAPTDPWGIGAGVSAGPFAVPPAHRLLLDVSAAAPTILLACLALVVSTALLGNAAAAATRVRHLRALAN
jgi:hypothetical protein